MPVLNGAICDPDWILVVPRHDSPLRLEGAVRSLRDSAFSFIVPTPDLRPGLMNGVAGATRAGGLPFSVARRIRLTGHCP